MPHDADFKRAADAMQAGRWDAVAEIADGIRAQDPANADAWFLRAMARQMLQDIPAAVEGYQEAIRLNPRHSAALNNFGVLLNAHGRFSEAADLLWNAVQIDANDADALYNLANSMQALGRQTDAINLYQRAIQVRPGYIAAMNNLAAMHLGAGRLPEALAQFNAAVAADPKSADLLANRAMVHFSMNQPAAAFDDLQQALKVDPNNAAANNHIANLSSRAASDPGVARKLAEVEIEKGKAFALRREWQPAEEHFRKALQYQPNSGGILLVLAQLFLDQCRFDDARIYLDEADRVMPGAAETLSTRGQLAYFQGHDAECEKLFNEALRLKPELDGTRLSRGMNRLRQQNFKAGWPDYEARHLFGKKVADFPKRWDGKKVGKLLVRAEQGLGDVLQFVRYLPQLRGSLFQPKAKKIILEVNRELMPLMNLMGGFDKLIAIGDPLPEFDAQVFLLSLPHVLGSIKATTPYLKADPALVKKWRDRLASVKGKKIGIAWQGSSNVFTDPLRSVPLAEFEPLAKKAMLINLQKKAGLDQIEPNKSRVPLVDFGAELDEASGAFMDTAAIMMNLDLVISSDTAIVHLAGALGRPVWMATMKSPDWRWFLEREDSPWYPTLRLFRQKRAGDWKDVFDRMAKALK